jgi:hypothetical protein
MNTIECLAYVTWRIAFFPVAALAFSIVAGPNGSQCAAYANEVKE